jgi:hypothetical protein
MPITVSTIANSASVASSCAPTTRRVRFHMPR